MSHSYKKHLFACYVNYKSNKKDKIQANKKFRRINRIFTKVNPRKLKYRLREVSNTYHFSSDGLAQYVGDSKIFKSNIFKDKEICRKWLSK